MYLLFCFCHLVNKEHSLLLVTRQGGESFLSMCLPTASYIWWPVLNKYIQQMTWHLLQTSGSQLGHLNLPHSPGNLVVSRDLGFVTMRWGCYWHLMGTRDTAPSYKMHKTAPTTKKHLAQNVNSADEKSCLRGTQKQGVHGWGVWCRGWVQGHTKLSWLPSMELKRTEEGCYFYNLSWVQMKRFCEDVCGTHHYGSVNSHQTVLEASNLTSTLHRKLSDLCQISLGKEESRAHKFTLQRTPQMELQDLTKRQMGLYSSRRNLV